MRGNTTELFKTWLRANHEFVVVVCSSPTFGCVFSSGCSQQSSEGRWKDFFFFFWPKMGPGKPGWPKDIESPSKRSKASGISLVVQWLRVCLAVQGCRFNPQSSN